MNLLHSGADGLKDAHGRVEARNLRKNRFRALQEEIKKMKGFIPMSEQGLETLSQRAGDSDA